MKYAELVGLVNEILVEYDQATIRQIYYRLVSPPYQYMDNTNSMYNSFDRMMVKARECGEVDWQKVVDHTRHTIEPDEPSETISDFMEVLDYNVRNWHDRYYVDCWAKQDYELRVFVEKDALAAIVGKVALNYRVAVIPGRGYSSFTQLKELALSLNNVGKPIKILYFGDFDPSGLDIDKSATKRIRTYSDGDIEVRRCALTEEDVARLPSSPVPLKKSRDSRLPAYIAKYGNRVWELDALPPKDLQAKVEAAITPYIKVDEWNEALTIELVGRKNIENQIKTLWKGGK